MQHNPVQLLRIESHIHVYYRQNKKCRETVQCSMLFRNVITHPEPHYILNKQMQTLYLYISYHTFSLLVIVTTSDME